MRSAQRDELFSLTMGLLLVGLKGLIVKLMMPLSESIL
jgi:preprotein translocase subunit Sss1